MESHVPKLSRDYADAYQLLLNGQDAISGNLTVCLLASDDNHLRVAVLSRQVNFCVSFLPNLESKRKQAVKVIA